MFLVPNILTILRILLIPIIAGTFYFSSNGAKKVAVIVFLIACVTDFLDGFFARKLKLQTSLGEFLDPLADKILIFITLFFLAGFGKLSIYGLIPASIIIIREILIVGLRSFLSKTIISVSYLAKWKTFLQMLSISMLLMDRKYFSLLGEILLWISAFITVYTGYIYIKSYDCK